jgi:DNA repair protein RecN (Recombination protein N)
MGMLTWLRIRDFALIDEADIELGPGFNVITGETGAGKSVLLGAVAMLLGERAETAMIRTGAARAEISAGLRCPEALRDDVAAALADSGLAAAADGELLIRRVIGATGGRNFLNDQPVTLDLLRRLGDLLIDLHGPHEHQSLLRPAMQLLLLDRYAGLATGREKTATAFARLAAARERLATLERELPSSAETEHLRSMTRDIAAAAPQPGEDEELSARHRLAAGSLDIVQGAARIAQTLQDNEGSAADRLAEAHRELAALAALGVPDAEALMARCDACAEAVRELAMTLEQRVAGIELDEQEFAALEERMRVLQTLKRRFGPRLEDVLAAAETARQRLASMENYDEELAARRRDVAAAETHLREACDELGQGRRKAAAKFAKAVAGELRKLGFPRAAFVAGLSACDPGPHGADRLEFLFSANPGEPPKPLRQVASSGEISRAMLALKTVLADADAVPILIFDEIDVNIGGETAGIVGQELHHLAAHRQVLCITHLPQVAARADTHFRVDKEVDDDRTFTRINRLDAKAREAELARMLGGGTAARRHATALLRERD